MKSLPFAWRAPWASNRSVPTWRAVSPRKTKDPSHGDLVFLGRSRSRSRCGRRLPSISIPVPSLRLSAISARTAENPGVSKVTHARPWTRWDLLSRPSGRPPWKPGMLDHHFHGQAALAPGVLEVFAQLGKGAPDPGVGCLLPGSHGKVVLNSPQGP